MATHNFQIFDESMNDTMSDIDYQSDSQRTNGVIPGVADPLLHNKLYRQCSVMAYAIAQVIVARGYNASDSDPVALVNAIQRTFAFSVNGNVPNASGAVTAVRPIDAWPVGSIFITMSNSNPSSLLGGGTWTKIQGKYLLATSSSYTVGNSYGSMTKTLVTANIPSHTHGFTTGSAGAHTHTASTASAGNHSHTRGSMNITGSIVASDEDEVFTSADQVTASGALRLTDRVSYGANTSHDGAGYMGISFDASRSGAWTGSTSTTGAHTHTVTVNSNGAHTHGGTTNSTGSGTAFNIMPESIAVNVWRRTA
jgi:microcystin-dependent protein